MSAAGLDDFLLISRQDSAAKRQSKSPRDRGRYYIQTRYRKIERIED